jgi:hypothetical protein
VERACDTNGRGEKRVEGFGGESPKEKVHLEDQGVGGRMGSEWSLGRLVGGVEVMHVGPVRDHWQALVNAVMNLRVLAPRS